MSNERISPEIRFSNYDDDWKQHNLGKVTLKIGSGKTPKGGSKTYVMKGIPFLRSQNIYNDKVNDNDLVYITEQVNSEMSNSEVKKNDVLLNITGASIGRSAVYNNNKRANVNQHVCIIRPKECINSEFIQLNLSSYNGQKQVDLNQAGGGREGLNFKQIANMNFNFPSLDEQIKISNFLNILSNTIALHQHELTLLKQRKKAFLQKMFPKKGESVPQVRFSHSNANWERKKLKDVSSYNSSKYSSNHFKKGEFEGLFPVFDANNMIAKINSYDMENEYISIIKDGAGVGRLNKRPAKSSVIGTMGYLTAKNSDIDFLYCLLTTFKFKKFIVGSTIPHVYFKDYGEVKINIPLLEEQKKIGQFFKQLDDDIALHEQKLERLKEMKKAFLQKMFV